MTAIVAEAAEVTTTKTRDAFKKKPILLIQFLKKW